MEATPATGALPSLFLGGGGGGDRKGKFQPINLDL